MAFSSVILKQTVMGNRKVSYGTFTITETDTGGAIDTGMRVVENFMIQHTGGTVITDAPVVTATFPSVGRTITIKTVQAKSGIWKAIGY